LPAGSTILALLPDKLAAWFVAIEERDDRQRHNHTAEVARRNLFSILFHD